MNDAQKLAFELRLEPLRELASKDGDFAGCMLATCSAHDPDAKEQKAMIRFLIRSGVSVNEADKNGVTPLHRAVRFRSLAAVDFLLANGADVLAKDRRSGSTALHRAVTNSGAPATAGKTDIAVSIVKSLLSHGADPNVKTKLGKQPTNYRMSETMTAAFENAAG